MEQFKIVFAFEKVSTYFQLLESPYPPPDGDENENLSMEIAFSSDHFEE